jgi:hypothetical protein
MAKIFKHDVKVKKVGFFNCIKNSKLLNLSKLKIESWKIKRNNWFSNQCYESCWLTAGVILVDRWELILF